MAEITEGSGGQPHVERAIALYLAGLTFDGDSAALLAAKLKSALEPGCGATQAIREIDERVREWLVPLVEQSGIPVPANSAAPRASRW